MRMTGNFAQLLHAFFYEWLAGQRNNSRHTVRSYRDTWRLFLRFTAARQQRPVAALRLADNLGWRFQPNRLRAQIQSLLDSGAGVVAIDKDRFVRSPWLAFRGRSPGRGRRGHYRHPQLDGSRAS